MPELLEKLHPVAYTCLLLMGAFMVGYAWKHRRMQGARRIGLLWLVPLTLELAYWFTQLR